MHLLRKRKKQKDRFFLSIRKSGLYLLFIGTLFITVSLLTTMKPTYRFSSKIISELTRDIESSTFLYLLGMENRIFNDLYVQEEVAPRFSEVFLKILTNIRPDDMYSFFGHEIPGFAMYGQEIIIAGEGTNPFSLSFESSPPLEDVLMEREAILEERAKEKEQPEQHSPITTGDKKIVFIYNTHNRESFLPHLPDVTKPNLAHHKEVNITKVSEHLAEALENYGIGTEVDYTDHMSVLNQKGWAYGQAYRASREAVKEVLANNKDIQYMFDIHRDSMPREKTIKEIDGEIYAKVMMVVGAEYESYERNLTLATKLHEMIEEKYPGLSRGVITKKGPGNNGVYNQDLLENALLIEFGGHENKLEELYRTADIIAEVFSDYYWEAEKVDSDS